MFKTGMTTRMAAGITKIGKSTLNTAFTQLTLLLRNRRPIAQDGAEMTDENLLKYLREMLETGELLLLDGTGTECPRPTKWLDQLMFYDYKHHMHDYQTIVLTSEFGEILAVHGGWPGKIPEWDAAWHSQFIEIVKEAYTKVVTDRGFRASHPENFIAAKGQHSTPQPGDAEITRTRAENERAMSTLKNFKIMERTRLAWMKHHYITNVIAFLATLKQFEQRVAWL